MALTTEQFGVYVLKLKAISEAVIALGWARNGLYSADEEAIHNAVAACRIEVARLDRELFSIFGLLNDFYNEAHPQPQQGPSKRPSIDEALETLGL